MTAIGDVMKTRRSPLGALAMAVLAVALGASVLAFGKMALVGLIGFLAFCVFVWYPVLGVYATTVLLLLSGSAGVIGPGGINVAVPLTAAKLCGAAALVAWLTNLVARGLRWHVGWAAILLGAFLLWSAVGVLFSPTRGAQYPEWIRLGTFAAFFVMVVDVLLNAPDPRRAIRTYALIILVCGLLSAASAVAQYFMPSTYLETFEERAAFQHVGGPIVDTESLEGVSAIRVSGRALHSNWLALLLLCVLPLNAYWFTASKTWQGKLLVGLAVLVELAALVLTFTRTGLLVGVVLLMLVTAKRLARATPYRFVAMALAVVVGWTVLPGAYKQRVLSLGQYTSSKSIEARAGLQGAAYGCMLEHPVKGVGLGGFGLHFVRERGVVAETMRLVVNEFNWNPLFVGVHNLYLQIGCETGVVGLALFLTFFVVMMRNLHLAEQRFKATEQPEWRSLAGSLQVSLVAFLLCGIFLHALQQKIWWIVAAGAVALSMYTVALSSDETGVAHSETKTEEAEAT